MDKRTCSIDGCERPVTSIGLCNAHYLRQNIYGDPHRGGPIKNTRAIDHPDGTRTCSTCQQRKPLDAFDHDKSARLGHRSQCKPCRGAHVAQWYQDNHERQLNRARERYTRNIDKVRAADTLRYQRNRETRIALATEHAHVRRARMRSGTYVRGITHKSLRKIYGDLCCYCGILMAFEPIPGTRYNPDRATIEHIIPISAGGAHDWDNVTLCCRRCNLRRNRTPINEWLTKINPPEAPETV